MELPVRPKGDELLPPGAMLDLRERLRAHARRHDLTTVAAYAFDHRTRMLPFFFVDRRMSPGGVRAVGSALLDAGFERTRLVLETWNRNFRPSKMRLDGRVPDLFLVSNMWIHSGRMKRLVADAARIPAAHRPLVVVGGPHMWYSPWDAFVPVREGAGRPDVAVTGEVYVLLELLDRLLSERGHGEPLRRTFLRMKEAGALDGVPGLVYPLGPEGRAPEELVDTGIQRLLGDLDELPHPALGFRLLEPPSRRETLADRPLAPDRVRRHSPIASIEMTYGCKFRCKYCPIPAYNQFKDRGKSPARIADEMKRLYREFGIRYFFGTDDNFFNRKERTVAILEELATTTLHDGTRLGKRLSWGTEATVHDTLLMRDHLRRARDAGLKALWLGVEDMTATLVKKGQSVPKTLEAFGLLQRNGIHPMPMLMHDDAQPLVSFRNARGLLNQIQLLRDAGAMTLQVLMLSPAPGSALWEESHRGLAYRSVNGRPVLPYRTDGNQVIASLSPRPWMKQLDILLAYAFFYNPLRFLKGLVRPKNRRGWFADAGFQLLGMRGVLQNAWRTSGWLLHLFRGRIVRHEGPPQSPIPLRSADGGCAAHAAAPRLPVREPARRRPEVVEVAPVP